MATQSREPTVTEEQERGLLGQIEVHSIDWIPDTEQPALLFFLDRGFPGLCGHGCLLLDVTCLTSYTL